MSILVILLCLVLGLLFIVYKRWSSRLYNHWKERGVVHRKPYPFVGNFIDNVLKKKSLGEVMKEIIEEFKGEKYIGLYNFITADLMITDPEIGHSIMIKEFSHFTDRLPEVKERRALDKHLMFMTGAEWKGVRSKVSPAFSSGKLKAMLPLMVNCYDYTAKYIDENLDENDSADLKKILDTYIISVSASTIYGMDPQRLADPQSEFTQTLDSSSKVTFKAFLLLTLNIFFPKVVQKFDLSPMGKKREQYFIDLVLNTFKERVDSGVEKDDIIQMLLQLKQQKKIDVSQWIQEDEEELGSEPSTITESIEITDEILVAQAFIFLMAGMDPLKSTMGMLLVEMSSNKKALKKAREEIQFCMDKYDGLTWQALKDMKYLDWCINETLRLFPPGEFIMRYCTKDYTFPDGPTVLKGERVVVPVTHILRNADYFADPDEFMPERFEHSPPPWVFQPFGSGPRMCLARRFALQEMKLFAVKLINDYDISLDSRTELPVKTDKWFFLRRNESDIYIRFNKRVKI